MASIIQAALDTLHRQRQGKRWQHNIFKRTGLPVCQWKGFYCPHFSASHADAHKDNDIAREQKRGKHQR